MSLLRLTVFGSPEVVHDSTRLMFSLRKAQALLLYLAVEGGMHSREKLASFFWPDSSPHDARKALRNALALLRHLLADAKEQEPHLCSEGDMLGINPRASLELDLDVVQHTYRQAQQRVSPLTEPQHSLFPTQVQHALALMHGPFLNGFWLHKDAPFDEWHEQQQRQWQVRLLFLLDRLSLWHEEAGEMHAAISTLQRWLVLDPFSEETTRRLMRVHVALGDVGTALQVYATYRTRLAEELQTQPSPETVVLAERIRTTQATQASLGNTPAHLAVAESQPPGELCTPLIGREAMLTQLCRSYERVRQDQPQGMVIVGEAGIGKTRLTNAFATWAKAQGAEVLQGQAHDMAHLPFQVVVDAIRPRVDQENAPEDVLDDLWLSELSSLLPELRVRYPDLLAPNTDDLTAKVRLFEAIAQLIHALAQRSPLVFLLDDLHWADDDSFEVLRYLARSWISRRSRVLLVGTVRSDEVERNARLAAQLDDLGRQLPLPRVALQVLSQTETHQLVEAFIALKEQHSQSREEPYRVEETQCAIIGLETAPLLERARPVVRLGEVLFAHTGGHPLYLLETLKLLRDRQWLIPKVAADDTWTLEQTPQMSMLLSKVLSRSEMLPTSVQMLIRGRLAKLAPTTQQLVQARAVLGNTVSARLLWQVVEVGEQVGITALEEAIGSGIVRVEEDHAEHSVRYRFAHELIREVAFMETSVARRQVLHRRVLEVSQREHIHVRACELAYHALEAGEIEAAYRYSVQAGMEAMALFAVKDAIKHYEQARALLREHPWLQNNLVALEAEQLYGYLERAYTALHL